MLEKMKVSNTPAVVDVNFDVLRDSLAAELKKYEVVVTADTVKDAKALATDLNKTKTAIDKRRKEEVAKASEPVKAFDAKMKELVQMCEAGRQGLLTQIDKFESETRNLAQQKLAEAREALWEECGVLDEFKRAEFDDLIKLTSLTGKGVLTSKALGELRNRVNDDLRIQERTRMRLMDLENQSYKAGLAAPLTRDHVIHFLNADDETYEAEVQRIIQVELGRQHEAEVRERERLNREQSIQAAVKTPEPVEPEVAVEPAAEAPQSISEDQPVNGLVRVSVTAVFTLDVPGHVTEGQISNKLKAQLKDAGFNTMPDISIAWHRQEAG